MMTGTEVAEYEMRMVMGRDRMMTGGEDSNQQMSRSVYDN